jgi:hypothetical protein
MADIVKTSDENSYDGNAVVDQEKATNAVSDHDAIGAGARGATLEDCIYYADLQYGNNDVAPPLVVDGSNANALQEGKVHEAGEAPAHAIAKGPLRFLWGPKSPVFHQAGKSDADVAHPTGPTVDAAHMDVNAQENRDTTDRIVLRKVSMLRAFFLITSDVLGPFQGPYVYSQVGYVPGTIVYIVMGVMAYLAGLILSVLYLRTDSDKMPVRNYGYLVQRLWGFKGKCVVDFFFIVQLIFQCGELLLTNAQSIALIVDGAATNADGTPKHHLCFTVWVVIFLIINLCFSPIRSLKTISWASALSLALAIIAVIVTTVPIFQYGPNYEQAKAAYGIGPGPVIAGAFVSQPLSGKVNGIMNMVYAYGGAQIFIDIFGEMRQPWSFWKSAAIAQSIIMTIYILFGILIYARQGQFVQSLYYFGISKYSWQTFGNAIGVYTGLVAAVLYGNIAQKELYYIVVRTWFKGPALMSKQGYPWWLLGNFVVWALAFVIGAGIPQVQTVSGVIAAISILQFSYSLPFLLKFTFDVQVDAMKGDAPYYVGGKVGSLQHRADSWSQWSRWRRGLLTGNVASKAFFFIIGLASVSMSCLGIYGSSEAIKATFNSGAAATSFGCATP